MEGGWPSGGRWTCPSTPPTTTCAARSTACSRRPPPLQTTTWPAGMVTGTAAARTWSPTRTGKGTGCSSATTCRGKTLPSRSNVSRYLRS
ncbi:hypothetical protein PR202_gb17791 [Eleusine coracana subsp. coracana]|uniref:Uncharacterized protein n=1 Tax=Eleusine coracana subsp. coracana TaxID=191504 RepID=A0AAV5F4J9_ELECO|nr:hypothetical protein PR202_gb17791 [Eleusine coracana subsp. coracana]